jgi:hypothetical protein
MTTNRETYAAKKGRSDGMASGWSRTDRASSDAFMRRAELTEADRSEYVAAYDAAILDAVRLRS